MCAFTDNPFPPLFLFIFFFLLIHTLPPVTFFSHYLPFSCMPLLPTSSSSPLLFFLGLFLLSCTCHDLLTFYCVFYHFCFYFLISYSPFFMSFIYLYPYPYFFMFIPSFLSPHLTGCINIPLPLNPPCKSCAREGVASCLHAPLH